MKKYIILFIIGLSLTIAQSQEIPDAVRFADDNLNGTARFRAMSGAFGALGGDLSSFNVNPAGSAIYIKNQMGFTFSDFNVQNKTNYYGTIASKQTNTLDINQIGAVFVYYATNPATDWKKFTMGINYENANEFDNRLFSAGTNPNNSVANYFLSYANGSNGQGGIPLDVLENASYYQLSFQDQQAFLGYQGYVINPLTNDPNNDLYVSNVPNGGNYYQENYFESSGYNGKLVFNLATQYQDKFFFGMNLNSHFTNYLQYTSFYESNDNSETEGLKNLLFENNLYTYGYGFSFQLGAIAKITNELRFGLAYESPTWYELNDQLNQSLYSRGYNYGNPPDPNLSNTYVASDYIIVYQPYNLQTPGKFTGSLAYVYGKKGLISFDYTLKDYGNTKFTPKDDIYNSGINNAMSNTLDISSEFRIGAEYRIQQLSLRGGYRFEGSPYKNKQTFSDLNGFSTGLGYNFGPVKIDFSYANSHRTSQQISFSQGFTDGAHVDTHNDDFSLTFLFDY